jgi:hypothetical protein
MAALHIERVDVGPDRIEALVRVTSRAFARTSSFPGLSARALTLLPGLSRHTCENGSAHGHVAELSDTETPHLLEHVACELMALSGSPRTLRGETAWDFSADGPGVFRIRLAYDDDLVCLGALRHGVDVVEWLLDPAAQEPDVARVLAELAVVRRHEV